MNVIRIGSFIKIALVGKDDKKYKDGPYNNVIVFIVLEDNKYQLKKYYLGVSRRRIVKKLITKQESVLLKEDEKGKISRDD